MLFGQRQIKQDQVGPGGKLVLTLLPQVGESSIPIFHNVQIAIKTAALQSFPSQAGIPRAVLHQENLDGSPYLMTRAGSSPRSQSIGLRSR